MNRPKGFLTITGGHREDGKFVRTQDAIDQGLLARPTLNTPKGWGIEKHELPIGENLFVDQGRQLLAYAFGFAEPISNHVCSRFGVGTGTSPAKVTDVALQNPIKLSNSLFTKEIQGVSFPAPFIALVEFSLGVADANGYLITELGLFSGDDTLLSRKTTVGINKSSEFAPVLSWRIRF